MPGASIGIVLQARMGSSRLPGKVLKPLAGVPMLGCVIRRLGSARRAGPTFLATTDLAADDAVAALGAERGCAVFRGSEADVLDRYYQCAKAHGLDSIVRATGDNPFVDAEELDRLVDFYLAEGLDYAGAFAELGCPLPKGIGLEIMGFKTLETAWKEGKAPHHREHVNEFILENPDRFAIAAPPCPPEKAAPDLSFTVDTPDEFARAEAFIRRHAEAFPGDEPSTPWLIQAAREPA